MNGLAMHVCTHPQYYFTITFVNKYNGVCTSKVIFCYFSLGWPVPDAVLGLNALVTNEAIIITWMVSSYQ